MKRLLETVGVAVNGPNIIYSPEAAPAPALSVLLTSSEGPLWDRGQGGTKHSTDSHHFSSGRITGPPILNGGRSNDDGLLLSVPEDITYISPLNWAVFHGRFPTAQYLGLSQDHEKESWRRKKGRRAERKNEKERNKS